VGYKLSAANDKTCVFHGEHGCPCTAPPATFTRRASQPLPAPQQHETSNPLPRLRIVRQPVRPRLENIANIILLSNVGMVMTEHSDSAPSRDNGRCAFRKCLLFGKRHFAVILILGILTLGLAWAYGPTSAQIRLDTGDLRYCWWGIPLRHELMPEPDRSKIMALARKSKAVPEIWVTCVRYPKHTSNNPDLMYQHFYEDIAMQADEDQDLAIWQLEDVAITIQNPTSAPKSMNGARPPK